MSDVRHYVEENQGLLKKIELSIPGFHGYRLREDLRTADNILRTFIADQIEAEIKKPLEEIGKKLTRSLDLDSIGDVRECINRIKGLEAKVRHAEHGYSGISPQFLIEEVELNKIYEFDVELLNRLTDLRALAVSLENFVVGNKTNDLTMAIDTIKDQVNVFENLFNQRLSFMKIIDSHEG